MTIEWPCHVLFEPNECKFDGARNRHSRAPYWRIQNNYGRNMWVEVDTRNNTSYPFNTGLYVRHYTTSSSLKFPSCLWPIVPFDSARSTIWTDICLLLNAAKHLPLSSAVSGITCDTMPNRTTVFTFPIFNRDNHSQPVVLHICRQSVFVHCEWWRLSFTRSWLAISVAC